MEPSLIIFTRPAFDLNAKTRLRKKLDDQLVNELHTAMLKDTLIAVSKSSFSEVNIAWEHRPEHKINTFGANQFIQEGSNFIAKFNHSLEYCFQKNRPLVIIGSDCPTLDQDILNQAYHKVMEEVVIGPTTDNNFYLLGLPAKNYLSDYKEVLESENQIRSLKELYEKAYLLPQLKDIDESKDLEGLSEQLSQGSKVKEILTNTLSNFSSIN